MFDRRLPDPTIVGCDSVGTELIRASYPITRTARQTVGSGQFGCESDASLVSRAV